MKQSNNIKVITRFAPSPTGEIHIGGARTALFAYLFSKHSGGDFLLRIEDTDRERLVEGSDQRIIDSLNWLGIAADNQNKPMIQSERLDIYKKYTLELINSGKAYICTCTKEELEKEREAQIKKGLAPRYSKKCRSQISDLKISEELLEKGATVRLKMPESGKIIVDDLIRGKVEFDASLLDDQIILKSDGFPTYHLASVVDDHEMGITHVIRSDEWLPSTPKHLVLYQAFGWQEPDFAHLSMILDADKKKLSKRHGAKSILEYKEQGYLAEALINYISLLGWNPKSERELFGLEELVKEFELRNVHVSPAVFDQVRLDFFNEHYLREKNIEELKELIGQYPDEALKLIQRGGYATANIARDYLDKLFKGPEYGASLLVFKKSNREATLRGLKGVLGEIKGDKGEQGGGRDNEGIVWTDERLQSILSGVVEREGLSNGDVFWPVRVALSGEEKSPSPLELMLALGKDVVVKRIEEAIGKLG